MKVRALSATGDWTFGKGQNDYLTKNRGLAQRINSRLLEFLGDCFFNLGAGIDWFTFLGSKDQAGLNLAISTMILNTSDVTGILQLSVALNSARKFTVSYRVQSIYSVLSDSFQYDLNGVA